MALAAKLWTVEEVLALPEDGNRHELIDGELFVTPSPTWRHGEAVEELHARVKPYVDAHRVGHVRMVPTDIIYGPRTVVVPDLFVVPLVSGKKPGSWEEAGRLLLAAEVLSPSTARLDRHRKRLLYQRERVPEYWIVDVDARLVERWRPEEERPEIVTGRLEWQPDAAQPALAIDLPAYFAEVLGEE